MRPLATVLAVAGLFLPSLVVAQPTSPVYTQVFSDQVTAGNGFVANDGKRYFDVTAGADDYQNDRYERPTVQTYEVRTLSGGSERFGASEYFGYLDIEEARAGFDSQYLYVAIDLASRDLLKDDGSSSTEGLGETYGFRLATDPNGAGGFLFVSDQPEFKNSPNTTFASVGLTGYADLDADVGGEGLSVTKEDVENEVQGNGYEAEIISDGRVGSGQTVFFVRIDPADPTIIEFALDFAAVGLTEADLADLPYLEFEAVKGGGDPQNYLWNDEYDHGEAGSPYRATSGDLSKSEFGTQGLGNIAELDTVRGGPLAPESPPTIAIAAPEDGALLNATPVSVSGTFTGNAVTIAVNGVPATVVQETFLASVDLADGVHTITAEATNVAGTATDSVTLTVDTTAPVVAITAPGDGSLVNASPLTVSGTVDDPDVATVDVNGVVAPVSAGSFSAEVPVQPGANTLTASASDAAGNTGSASVGVILDPEPPTLSITHPPDGTLTTLSLINVAGTVADENGVDGVDVNGVAATISGGTWEVTAPLSLGANAIVATATDLAGNTAAASIVVSRGTIPGIAITAPANGAVLGASPVTVTGTVTGSEPLAVDVNGVAATVTGETFSASVGLAEGETTLTATAANAFGTGVESVALTVDLTDPSLAIGSPADGTLTTDASVEVSGTVGDANGIASLTVNGQSVAPSGGTFATSVGLALGENPIVVVASDPAGRTTTVAVTVTRGVLPVVAITAPVAGALFADPAVTVTGTYSGADAVTVNGVSATLSGGSFSAEIALGEGGNTVTAVATSAFGDAQDAVSATLDTLPPVLAIDAPANQAKVTGTPVTVSGTVVDATGASGITVNGVPALLAGTIWSLDVALEPGGNLLNVVAVDAVGNAASQPLALTLQTAPEIVSAPVTSATEDVAYVYDAEAVDPNPAETLTFSLAAAPAGMTIDPASGVIAWTPGNEQVGEQLVLVAVVNTQGQAGNQLFAVQVAQANDPPAITSTPPSAAEVDETYAYEVTASDPDASDTLLYSLDEAPPGMEIDASGGEISWTPVVADVGEHPITVRVTDAAGLSASQSYTLRVVLVPPVVARPALARNAAYGPDGATVVAASSEVTPGSAALAIDRTGSTAWTTATGETTNQFIRVDLTEGLQVLGEIRLRGGISTSAAPRNFEVRVSKTGTDPEDFVTVFSGEHPANNGALIPYTFPPVQARYVELLVLDNHGASEVSVARFHANTRRREGAIVSLAGSLVAVSSESSPSATYGAQNAFDQSLGTVWRAAPGRNTNEWLKLELADERSHRVRAVYLRGSTDVNHVRNFEIAFSNTTADDSAFTTVATGTLNDLGLTEVVTFPDVEARYLRFGALDNYGGSSIEVRDIRVYADSQGAQTVPFDELTDDPEDPPVAFAWDFGDGNTSFEQHPEHTYAEPGEYLVSLEVTRASGLVGTLQRRYVALPRPEVDFVWTPVTPLEDGSVVSFEDRSYSPNGAIIEAEFDFPNDELEPGETDQATFSESGDYEVVLAVWDDHAISATGSKAVTVENLSPTSDAGGDRWAVWGQTVTLDGTVSDPSADDGASLTCIWDFGDGESETIFPCDSAATRVTHDWPAPGTYIATLTVVDKDGGSTVDTIGVVQGKRTPFLIVTRAGAMGGGGDVEVRARLFDSGVGPLPGRSVDLSIGGQTFSGVTDAAGDVALVLPFVPGAENTVEGSFAGDAAYQAVTGAGRFFAAALGETPSQEPPSSSASAGKSFMVDLQRPWDASGNRGPYFMDLNVTSTVPTVATVEAPGLGIGPVDYAILPDRINVIEVVRDSDFVPGGVIVSQGVSVETQHEVWLTVSTQQQVTSDSTLALPVDALGTEYYAASYFDGSVSIAGTEDDTQVAFRSSGRFGGQPPDTPLNIWDGDFIYFTLDRHEVISLGGGTDISGSWISADKPIAVFGGSGCVAIGGRPACDITREQLPPSFAFGTRWLATAFAEQNHGALLRVVGAASDTQIFVDGALVETLDRFEPSGLIELPQTGGMEITTSKPALVYQFMKSMRVPPFPNNGDPAMIVLVPEGQFAPRQTILSLERRSLPEDYSHYLNIIAPASEVGGMRLDGQPITGVIWEPVASTEYAGAQVPVGPGVHDVRHVSPLVNFTVVAYGMAIFESYAHTGSTRLRPIHGTCSATPAEPGDGLDNDCDGVVDEEIADGLDQDGDGLVDEDVQFGTPGVNLAPGVFDASLTLDEDTSSRVVLAGFDANGDVLTYRIVTPPAHGTVEIDGVVARYFPDESYFGPDSFTFVANDGTSDSNEGTVTLTVSPLPDSPGITSTPVTSASQDAAYSSLFEATDPDAAETFTWSLLAGPEGMAIDSASGVLSWTPTDAQVGGAEVTVQVADSSGLRDSQTFRIQVANVNDPPAITSTPPGLGQVGQPLAYAAAASDPDPNELLSWTLEGAPPGMAVGPVTGVVTWTPAPGQEGTQGATLRVTDAGGLSASQPFTLDIAADTTPPAVTVTASRLRLEPGQDTTLTLAASDGTGIATSSLTVNGTPLAIDTAGRAVFTPSDPGPYDVVASATDTSGNVGTASLRLAVEDLGDTEPPVVALEAPAELEELTFLHDVIGTADDPNLFSWQLTLSRVNETEERTLAADGTPVISDTLAELDTTLLANGLYTLTLRAEDTNGQKAEASHAVRVDGGAKVGVVRLAFVDSVVPMAGIPIQVIRRYDSRDKTVGEFGYGWRLDLAAGSLQHNRPVGSGWNITQPPGDFVFPCTLVEELDAHATEVRVSEREFYIFRPRLVNLFPIVGGCTGAVIYEQVDGTTPGATLDILEDFEFIYAAGSDTLRDLDTLAPFNPDKAELTTADGRIFELDLARGVTAVEDRNGNYVVIGINGVVHSAGKAISFLRDAHGRIEILVDPLGQTVEYGYDAAGDLVSVRNQIQETTHFEYLAAIPHHLDRMIRDDGVVVADFAYDADGRMDETCDADGACASVDHDLASRRELQSDGAGVPVTYAYDERGNVTSRTDGLGNTAYFEYDERDNLTRLEDPEGGVTTFVYDESNNLLSRTDPYEPGEDPADFTTAYTYNDFNQLTALTLPSGATVYRDYDAAGNETAIRDDLGNTILEIGYLPDGLVGSETDRYGTTTYAYDGDAEPSSAIDPFGRISAMVYDTNGNLTSMTDETGTGVFQYDGLGRDTFSDYGNGITSLNEYDLGAPDWTAIEGPTLPRIERRFTAAGRLGGWGQPDGGEVTFLYDPAGRLIEEIDPLGKRTTTTYDAAGRPETVTDEATGATTTTERDRAGRPERVIDALGNPTAFTYTPGGLVKTRTNARFHTWENSYTPTSTTVRDPLDRETTVERSAYGLPVKETYPDGTFTRFEYEGTTLLDESDEFPKRLVDEAGRERLLDYNGFGQLVSATDLAGETWLYEHEVDELRRVVSPEGAVARELSYDVLGDLTTITYPNGNARTITYGPDRNPETVTLPQGTVLSYSYDGSGREATRTSSQGESRSTTYRTGGQIEAITDATGTTEYLYDDADRFAGLRSPHGGEVRYARDLLGRVTHVTVKAHPGAAEQETVYGYDEVGNLTSVLDPIGGLTEIDYDEVNRPTERRLPNGVVTSWTYDLRDRPLSVVHEDAMGQVLASVAYDRGLSGEPTRITREDGSYVEIDYDGAWRISEERYFDASDTHWETISYTYDRDGNRTSRTTGAGAESYSYANGFELDSITGPGGTEAYGTDPGGRLTSLDRPDLLATFAYDSDDHITQAVVAGGPTVDYAFDAEGRRVEATSTVEGTRRYLVAPVLGEGFENPHVATDTFGTPLATWIYAGEWPMLRIDATGQPVYYLEDPMGSMLALADASGARTARFAYDAFGIERDASGSDAALPGALGGDFRYHGQWQDAETGLYHVRARAYDPRAGRFTSRDPVEGVFETPESYHPYTWNANNPHVFRDPSGQTTLISLKTAQGVSTTLRSIVLLHTRDFAIDYAKAAAGDILVDTVIRTIVPEAQALDPFSILGTEFEEFVQNNICRVLEGSGGELAKWLWLQPSLEDDGDVAGNGFNCGDSPPSLKGIGHLPRPDFIVKDGEPKDLKENGYFVGDIKAAVKHAREVWDPKKGRQRRQFKAMMNYAKDHSYSKTAVLVTLRKGKGVHRKKLQRYARKFFPGQLLIISVL